MAKYSIGIDYGSLSGRAVLVDTADGREVAQAVLEYPHGVMTEALPCGKKLPQAWALQHPRDYLNVLKSTVPEVLERGGVAAEDVVGVGVDFTACTVLPVKRDGTPLCFLPAYENEPHAYVKLWKHHAAEPQAQRITALAAEREEAFLPYYGGKVSSEWLLPKALQMLEEREDVFFAADKIVEAGDWIVWMLTGRETRNSCAAGYKALYRKGAGYPSEDFLTALDKRLSGFTESKLGKVSPTGTRAGGLSAYGASLTGLREGTAVAVAGIDAHVAVPALGITTPGKMLMILGTSTCHMLLSDTAVAVPGISGVVADGILPGYYGYEAGQACVGDHFQWAAERIMPGAYREEAQRRGLGIHEYLTELAARQKIGEHGLVALDWWNGCRTPLVDYSLRGVIAGLSLDTRAEDVYRALIEATAYGTRAILDTFEERGVTIDELYACGGIASKNALLLQIYADVTGRTIRLSASSQAVALGSAIFGAVAAGSAAGGYDTVAAAAAAMSGLKKESYAPVAENAAAYRKLYRKYLTMQRFFGREHSDLFD